MTVIGLLASAIVLFSLIGVEVRQHRLAQVHQALVYSQNFFAGIISASLYVLVAVLLSIYMISVRVSPFDPAERRKIECTSIVFRVTSFAILLLGGAAVYSAIEGWSLMDALYFTNYTLLTIGLGNLVPQSHLGRSLLFPYATLGITNLGLVITAVASFTDQARRLKLKRTIEEARKDIDAPDLKEKLVGGISTGEGAPSQSPLVNSRVPKAEEIIKVRDAKSAFYRRRRWVELGFFLAAWFVLWLASAGVFRHSEKDGNWTYFVALYFTYTSLTTIGYGDYFPTSNFGKVFFIFWSLLAIPILTNLVAVIGNILHVWLTFCSAWIRRHVFCKGHTENHDHEYMCRLRDTSGCIATDNPLGPYSRAPAFSIEGRSQGYPETREDLPSAQVGLERSSLVEDDRQQVISRRASTGYRLLLSEEIRSLLSMMRDESQIYQEELCCKWSRVIPMLQASSGFFEVTPIFMSVTSDRMIMRMLSNPEKELSERNAEILWMLTLLVEKLSSDLQKELSETIP